ncbi:MAG: hypothetical protein WC988_00160 [Patescibacteria group bacterium]
MLATQLTNVGNESQQSYEKLNPHDVVVFATTFYKNWQSSQTDITNADSARGNASIDTFRQAVEGDYQVVVVDGGSSKEYLETLERMGVKVLAQEKPGMVEAKREALEKSVDLNPRVLLLIQAEKTEVIPYISQLVDPIARGEADIVMAGRDPSLFRTTYPSFQVESEEFGNRWCNRIAQHLGILPTDTQFDWFFGVKAFRNDPELVRMFMERYQVDDPEWAKRRGGANPERYTNFDFFPVLAALHSDRKVVGVDIPFSYPPKQKAMEETLAGDFIEKRRMQRETILVEVMQFARYLVDESNPKGHLSKQPSSNV